MGCFEDGSPGNVLTLRISWTRNETLVTHSRASPQVALSSAVAWITQIEILVTVLVIVVFRTFGCIKENRSFSWDECLG